MSESISKGFDRNIDYETTKNKLIEEFNRIKNINETNLYYDKCNKNKLIYLTISMIQLRNGSRISEACSAFKKFIEMNKFDNRVTVKIAKSEGLKYNRAKKEKVMMKARFREITFPKWIDTEVITNLKSSHTDFINDDRLKKRVLDYLLNNFKFNTHSLRYAFINHMLMVKNTPMNIVSKFVGHTTVNQLVTYTQNKHLDAIFDDNM